MEDLKKRVDDFNSLRLPGQPFGMHMGTSYLVNDLWKEIQKRDNDLRKLIEELRVGGKSLSTDATHAYMFCADKIEKLLDGGE